MKILQWEMYETPIYFFGDRDEDQHGFCVGRGLSLNVLINLKCVQLSPGEWQNLQQFRRRLVGISSSMGSQLILVAYVLPNDEVGGLLHQSLFARHNLH